MMVRCHYCGQQVDPDAPEILQAAWGWEAKAAAQARKSGSDILFRQPFARWAHRVCVDRERAGVNARQGTLIG